MPWADWQSKPGPVSDPDLIGSILGQPQDPFMGPNLQPKKINQMPDMSSLKASFKPLYSTVCLHFHPFNIVNYCMK